MSCYICQGSSIVLTHQNENFSDEKFMAAAPYLHRQFLLNLDIFQRDLFYHGRYVAYLIDHKSDPERYIVPTIFVEDLRQEENALSLLDSRLKAIRERTTTILEMVGVDMIKKKTKATACIDDGQILNITNIEQARLSSALLKLQRADAQIAFRQGESIKRLTMLNMIYLPPWLAAVGLPFEISIF